MRVCQQAVSKKADDKDAAVEVPELEVNPAEAARSVQAQIVGAKDSSKEDELDVDGLPVDDNPPKVREEALDEYQAGGDRARDEDEREHRQADAVVMAAETANDATIAQVLDEEVNEDLDEELEEAVSFLTKANTKILTKHSGRGSKNGDAKWEEVGRFAIAVRVCE